jgi:4-diphosphocytidyl-2-C-methyl-D-erythritol kinase
LGIKKRAYAKVNLALDVLGRRENGYHDVKMVMQNLDIYDELEFELCDTQEGSYSIIIKTDNPDIPTDERNLIYKAARLLLEEYGIQKKLTVRLEKNIPVEAGMAGGSTDAAATLHAVNELAGLGLSTKQLMDHGVRLGADVPFCVLGKTALSEGIGEILTEIPALPGCFVAVAKPAVGVSTKLVYTELDNVMAKAAMADETAGVAGESAVKNVSAVVHPNVDVMVAALKEGVGVDESKRCEIVRRVAGLMGNVLESVTIPMHPEIAEIKCIMLENGAINAMMSGSGPTVYGIYEDEKSAETAVAQIRAAGLAAQTFVTKPV